MVNDCLIIEWSTYQPVSSTVALRNLPCVLPRISGSRHHSVRRPKGCHQRSFHSSSLDSSSSSEAAFFAGFFFFFLFLLFDPVDLDSGFSNICKISSSVILWSDFKLPKSGVGGAASLVMPFLVIARFFCQSDLLTYRCL